MSQILVCFGNGLKAPIGPVDEISILTSQLLRRSNVSEEIPILLLFNRQAQVEVERKLALEAEAGKFRPGETSGLEYPDSGKGSHLD